MTTVSAQPIHAALLAALQAVPGLHVYDGEVPDTPALDPDGRVHPYAVLYGGPGRSYWQTLTATPTDLDMSFQVTCVGGDPNRCLWAVDRVRQALTGTQPTVDSAYVGHIAELDTYDPGPVRRDDDVRPPRSFVPLLFTLTATTT